MNSFKIPLKYFCFKKKSKKKKKQHDGKVCSVFFRLMLSVFFGGGQGGKLLFELFDENWKTKQHCFFTKTEFWKQKMKKLLCLLKWKIVLQAVEKLESFKHFFEQFQHIKIFDQIRRTGKDIRC